MGYLFLLQHIFTTKKDKTPKASNQSPIPSAIFQPTHSIRSVSRFPQTGPGIVETHRWFAPQRSYPQGMEGFSFKSFLVQLIRLRYEVTKNGGMPCGFPSWNKDD